ncbi:uncharacterized protein LOC143626859 [Bidens hawaiensis]|uniref:uncharacterized protein LOC143626859 n=1 Tax=Bidens hawaiensis TaxID=980011 RepID=UPI00404B5044
MAFYYSNNLITWSSQKQKTVALSSCEAEFMAATSAACQALWLRNLIGDLMEEKAQNYENQHYFQDRAITPTNEIVDEINDSLLKFFPGDEVEYLSSDTVCSSEYINGTVDAALYSPKLLNGLRISGLPNHKLVIKVGVPVMLLRNLNQKEGLCNDTRLQIISLGTRVVKAKIVSGTNFGHTVLIHRSPLTPTDNK